MRPHGDCELAATFARGQFIRSAKARRFGPPAREKLGWAGVQAEVCPHDLGLSNPVVRIGRGLNALFRPLRSQRTLGWQQRSSTNG